MSFSCYHSNIALLEKNKIIKQNGDLGNKVHRIIFSADPSFKGYEYYFEQNRILQKRGEKPKYKLIPCGKCQACRQRQTREWALRLELEAKQYKNNYFITLTYDEEHLPMKEYSINPVTGEKFENQENWREWKGTVIKEHTIRFIKSLRQYFERDYNWEGMRFYLCSEYGEKGERPHYHAILLNCPKLDLICIGQNTTTKQGYFTHERIEKIWGKGFINIGEVTWDSISYVTGYCQKKLFGEVKEEVYAIKGQNPIFANMSRKPGIGREYFDLHATDIYKLDEIINSKGKSVKPPSYYDRLMDIGEHDVMEEIKAKREEIAEYKMDMKMKQTKKTMKEQMEIEERTAKEKQKHYNRERIRLG